MSEFILNQYLSERYVSILDPYPLQSKEFNMVYHFYEALREGSLTTTICKSCGKMSYPPRIICPECYSQDLEWKKLPTSGKVLEFVEMKDQLVLCFEAPMVIAVVDLNGVIKLSSRIIGVNMGELKVGDEVKLKVFPIEPVPMEDRKGNITMSERVFFVFEKA